MATSNHFRRRRRRLVRSWRARRTTSQGPTSAPRGHVRSRHRAPAPSFSGVAATLGARPARLASGAAAMVLAAALAFTAVSPRYRVSGAAILGNARLSHGAIYALSGLHGLHSFALNKSTVAERLETLPDIRAAEVDLVLPSRVVIHVQETRPTLLLTGPHSAVAIDEVGVAIAPPADPAALDSLVRVTILNAEAPSVGTAMGREFVAAAVKWSTEVDELRWDDTIGLVAVTADGWELRLGTAPAFAERQLATLAAMRVQLGPDFSRVALVDLRYPTRPYYRLHDGTEAP